MPDHGFPKQRKNTARPHARYACRECDFYTDDYEDSRAHVCEAVIRIQKEKGDEGHA